MMKRRNEKKMTNSKREILIGLCFVLPGLIYMLVMIGYPIAYNLFMSFQDVSVFNIGAGEEKPWIGLENYRKIVANETMLPALKNTFLYTVVCLAVQFSVGLLLALLFHRDFALAKPLRGFLVVSWMMPVTVTARCGTLSASCLVYCEPASLTGTVFDAELGLNVRSGPGSSYPALGGLENGQKAIVQAVDPSGWYVILFYTEKTGVCTGYVSPDYFRLD